MSTQTLPSTTRVEDIYNFQHFQFPDERLQTVMLQPLTSLLELEGLFSTPPFVMDEFNKELRQEFSNEIALLELILKANDLDSYKHSLRVKVLTNSFLKVLDLPQDHAMLIEAAAFLHDLGKIAIDATLLHKSTPLTVEEFEVIKKHPALGAMIISQFKAMQLVMPLIYYHHERWDGNGYPAGLRGEDIPSGARILAITDAYDAMTSQRPYQPLRTPAEALAEIHANAGTQFDPQLASKFCNSMESWHLQEIPSHIENGEVRQLSPCLGNR
ncbi:MAG TPA: HD domain-containing phosphohydrolase [Ktedonobacteraceae bacterium]